jgi:predicted YcjX-like family ATPase
MADIHLQHPGVSQAIDDMVRATAQMRNAMQQLMQGLAPFEQTFEADGSRPQWDAFKLAVSAADHQMQNSFGKGAVTLGEMQQIHIDSDRRGTNLLGG